MTPAKLHCLALALAAAAPPREGPGERAQTVLLWRGVASPADTDAGLLKTLAAHAGDPRHSDTLALGATRAGGAEPPPPPPSTEGLRWIGRFAVLREIGRGAMGVVYAGYDEELDRRVAIKLVSTDDHRDPSLGRNQLLREAQALARLTHPNVVTVFEAGVHDGRVYLAMEYVEGVDLQRWLTAAPRAWRDVVAAFLQAGAGLLAAHKVGLVHRDFKPSNVLVGDDGRVRVADFGLAARSDRPDVTDLGASRPGASAATVAVAGSLVGTPAYMAPELFRHAPASAASDQYAFCVALYEALNGEGPFTGDTLFALARAVLEGELPAAPPDPTVPAWVHALVLRGLARDPAARFPDLGALLAELARDPELERRRRRQRIAQLTAAVLGTLLLVFGGGALYRFAVRDAHERRAVARLDALREQLVGLQAEGRADEAARVFASFVALEDNRGTAALGRAYSEWGALQPDHAAAIDAFAAGYVHARRPRDRQAALRGLTLRLAAHGDGDGAMLALATLDAQAPELAADPELAALRLSAALERRDLPAALAALQRHASDDLRRAAVPVLRALSSSTETRLDGAREPHLTPRDRLGSGDLDGDGRPELLVLAPERGPDVVRVLRGDPTLAQVAELRVPPLTLPDGAALAAPRLIRAWPLPASFGGGPRLFVEVDADAGLPDNERAYGLVPLTQGAAPELAWTDSLSYPALGDLDGDGAPELYLGTGAYSRHLLRLTRDAAGAWQRDAPHPRTNGVHSDINDLVVGDLDGDGLPELVVAVGPWTAYDLRVFRARGRGELDLVARKTLGCVSSLALVRDGDGLKIAAVKRDDYPSPRRFAKEPHTGPPAGLYILDLAGDELAVEQHLPFPASGEWSLAEAVDLDGDARDELVVNGPRGFLVYPRGPRGLLEPLRIAGAPPALAMDLDGDPAAELVVPTGDGRALVLGAGDAPTPALPRELPAARPVREDINDPAIAEAWRNAEELAAIGLVRRSADALVALSGFSKGAREDILLRAGELYAAAGEHAAAAANFEAAAARPRLAAEALAGAIRGHRMLREFAAATTLAEARAALPDLPAAERAASEAEAAALRRTAAARPELSLRFDGPLDPGWRIHDPLAVSRDLGARALTVSTSTEPLLAELPLAWDGGSVDLTVDLTVDAMDWSTSLDISVGAEGDDEAWLAVAVRSGGNSKRPDRSALVLWGHSPETEAIHELLPQGFTGRVRLHLRHDVELGVGFAEVLPEGLAGVRRSLPHATAPTLPTPPRGPLQLRLHNRLHNPMFAGRVRLHAIDLVGFRPVAPAAAADGDAETARLLAEGELGAALARLADAKEGRRGLWRAELLAQLDRDDEAAALLAALLGRKDDWVATRLYQLVMHDPAPIHRVALRVLGDALVEDLAATLTNGGDLRPSTLRRRLTEVDAHPRARPATGDPLVNRRHCAALIVRGTAWVESGRADLARGDLEAAWQVLDDPTREFPDRVEFRRRVSSMLLELAVAAKDRAAARRWLGIQRIISAVPEISLEYWRDYPGLLDVVGADAFAEQAALAGR